MYSSICLIIFILTNFNCIYYIDFIFVYYFSTILYIYIYIYINYIMNLFIHMSYYLYIN